MIKDFLIINCIGQNDLIGLRKKKQFFKKKIKSIENKEILINSILKFLETHKIDINPNFSILVNIGPGSFSAVRKSLSIAKGIKISKGAKIYGFKNNQLQDFTLENIDFLISNKNLENKLIKPIYELN